MTRGPTRRLGAVGVMLLFGALGCSSTTQQQPAGELGEGINEAAEGAIEACRSAQRQALSAPTAERYGLLAEGCADLFSMPMCREAFRLSARAETHLRIQMITVACQVSYCPSLEADPPALCDLRPAGVEAEELDEAWGGFVAVVLPYELGIEMSTPLGELLSLSVGPMMFEPLRLSNSNPAQGAEPPVGPRLMVRLERVGAEFRVGANLAETAIFGPWMLPLSPDEGDFSGLLENAMRQAAGAAAVIEVSGDIPQPVIVNLLDALRAGGITEVALSP